MKEELRIEQWTMDDFSVQASIAPELFGDRCDAIEISRNAEPVLAVLPWSTFLALLRELTLEKHKGE